MKYIPALELEQGNLPLLQLLSRRIKPAQLHPVFFIGQKRDHTVALDINQPVSGHQQFLQQIFKKYVVGDLHALY